MLSSAVPFIFNKHTLEPVFAVNVGTGICYDLIHASINSIVYWFLTQFKQSISILLALIQVFKLFYKP